MDTVFSCVIPYIQNGDDRNSVSLVCRNWNEIDCLTRKHVTVHMYYAPAPSRLSKRFPYLNSLTLEGIDNDADAVTEWIREISVSLMHLKSLRICSSFISDSDLELLARTRGKDLMSLKLYMCKGFDEYGLMCVAKHCSELRVLCVDAAEEIDRDLEEHENWLRVLALRKTGIEKFSYIYDAPFGPKDLAFLVEKCRESLVSLRVDLCDIADVGHAINNAVNLQEFSGAYFDEEEQCSGFTFPSSIHSLGLLELSPWSIRFFNPLLNQLRELECRELMYKRTQDCQCLFFQRCPNLEVLHASDECGDTGLQLISKFCRKLRKLTVHSGTHMGLMAVAQGCPNLEYLDVSLTDISNESLECVGSNLKNLRVLCISGKIHNPRMLLDNGIRALLMGCTKLERLDISKVFVTDVGLGFVGEYGVNLRYLSLCKVGKSDEGLLKITKGCLKLRRLEFSRCSLKNQVVKDLWLNRKLLRYISFNGRY